MWRAAPCRKSSTTPSSCGAEGRGVAPWSSRAAGAGLHREADRRGKCHASVEAAALGRARSWRPCGDDRPGLDHRVTVHRGELGGIVKRCPWNEGGDSIRRDDTAVDRLEEAHGLVRLPRDSEEPRGMAVQVAIVPAEDGLVDRLRKDREYPVREHVVLTAFDADDKEQLVLFGPGEAALDPLLDDRNSG